MRNIRDWNKKGEDLSTSEIVGIVLFFIIAFIIIAAVWMIIKNIGIGQENRNVNSVLENLQDRINSVQEGNKLSVQLTGPCKEKDCEWFIASWSQNNANKPASCGLNSCICLCKGDFKSDMVKSLCEAEGVCKNVNIVSVISSSEIDKEVVRAPEAGGNTFEIVKIGTIPLQSNYIEVNIEKKNGVVTLTKI